MRILLTIHHPLESGTGAPGVTVALRDAFRAAGAHAEVASFDDLPAGLPEQAKDLLFPWYVAWRVLAGRFDVVDASTGDAWIWGRLRRLLRRPGVLASRSHGLAHTFWDAELLEAAESGRTLPLRSRIYHGRVRLAQDAADMRGADLCLFLNAADRTRAIEELGVAAERALIVRTGVPDALIGLPAPAAEEGPIRIAHIGSHAARKGVRHVAAALAPLLADHAELKVTYLGTRASAETVHADYPADLHDRVHVVETYERDALPELLRGHQIYVSGSLAEGLSLALIEAMACGLAPVVTDLPGVRAVLDGPGDGVLVTPGDPASLRDGVRALLDDRDRLRAIRAAAQARAQRFSWEDVARDQLALYTAAAGQNADLPPSPAMPDTNRTMARVRTVARTALSSVQTRTGLRIERVPDAGRPERTHADIADPVFFEYCRRCAPYTMTSVERMFALYQAIEHVHRRRIAGDIVECGVWRGGSSMLAALQLLELGDSDRRLWLYDTFEGMPEPGEHDADPTGASMAAEWERHEGNPDDPVFAYASLDDVQRTLFATGFPTDRLRFAKGKVEETIPATIPDRIAVLRLDTDWYESTRHELEHLYPRLAPGGVLIIDDYGHWQGARRAVDEWLAAIDAPPLLTRIDETGRIGVKPA